MGRTLRVKTCEGLFGQKENYLLYHTVATCTRRTQGLAVVDMQIGCPMVKMLRLSYKNLTYSDHDPRYPDPLGFRIVGGFLRGWTALFLRR
jgi:hypothetical protein